MSTQRERTRWMYGLTRERHGQVRTYLTLQTYLHFYLFYPPARILRIEVIYTIYISVAQDKARQGCYVHTIKRIYEII